MCFLYFEWRRRRSFSAAAKKDAEDIQGMRSPMSSFFSPTLRRPKTSSVYENVTWGSFFVCLLPAICDLGGTTLSGIGLLFTSASVFQMLRGSIIVFTGVLSVVFLGRKLAAFQVVGMIATAVGITMVGMSSICFHIDILGVWFGFCSSSFSWNDFFDLLWFLVCSCRPYGVFSVETCFRLDFLWFWRDCLP